MGEGDELRCPCGKDDMIYMICAYIFVSKLVGGSMNGAVRAPTDLLPDGILIDSVL